MAARLNSKNRRILKEELFFEQDGICGYCKCKMVLEHGKYNQPKLNTITIEHIRPHSKNGTNRRINLIGVCYKCNHERGDGKHYSRPGNFKFNDKKIDTFCTFTSFPMTYIKYGKPLVWQISKTVLKIIH